MLMLLIGFLSSYAIAESPNPPRAGRIEGRATYSYFNTDSNYSSTGANALTPNGSLVHMQGEFTATYDWQPDWRFYAGLNGGWVETDDGFYTRNNSGVNEIFVGAQKWYESGPLDIVPQGDFIFPLWRPDTNSDEALIGEGAMRIRGGAWAFWPLGTYKPFAYAGFEYRDGGRAFLVPYEAGIKFKFPVFWLQASFRGYESVVDDADSDNQIVREAYLKHVNGGSLRFYSVNPSGSEVSAEAGTQLGSWGLFAGFAITVNGNNSADGWTGYGGLSWTPMPSKKQDDGFNIRKERFDEGLFKEEDKQPQFVEDPNFKEPPARRRAEPPAEPADMPPPSRATPSKPVEMQLQLRRVPPKKKKKAPVRKRSNKKLDSMMNDAESALENAN